MNDAGKILVAFIAGAAVGATLGILFAPDKGSETRRKLSEQGKKMAEEMKEKFQKGKDRFNAMKKDIDGAVKEEMEEYA